MKDDKNTPPKKKPYSPKSGKRAKSIQDLRDYAKTLGEGKAEEDSESAEVEGGEAEPKEKAPAPKKGKGPKKGVNPFAKKA